MATIDLSTLPKPTVIQELDHQAIVDRQLQSFLTIWNEKRVLFPDLPEYTVDMLESDPFAIDNEAESWREVLLRAEINDVFRATLLYFAKGGNLDHLAAFNDVVRMPGETDDRLLNRVLLAIMGRSTGGPKERYQSIAMSADLRVEWAEPYRIGRSPVVYVAIFSTETDGVASVDLLDKVRAALTQAGAQLVNDTIIVQPAVRRVVNLTGDIWILPDADDATVTRAVANLRAEWDKEQKLGRDLTMAWVISKLMISGVHDVVLSSNADEVASPTEAIAIGTVALNLRGRAY
jgi:phage-related baseplate assembly protein